jgi:solute carrier family 39 (zinc transporter), member 1/2/3
VYIAEAKLPPKNALLLLLVFACTTPLGIAVGMGLAATNRPGSPAAAIVEGVASALSAGVRYSEGGVQVEVYTST